MIVRPGNTPQSKKQVGAMIVWMSDEQMVPGKEYLFKQGTKMVTGNIDTLRYQVDVNTLHRVDAPTLGLNEIGRCNLSLSESLCFDSYRKNRGTGAFIIIDRITNVTVAAGMIIDRTSGDSQVDLWESDEESSGGEQFSTVDADQRKA